MSVAVALIRCRVCGSLRVYVHPVGLAKKGPDLEQPQRDLTPRHFAGRVPAEPRESTSARL